MTRSRTLLAPQTPGASRRPHAASKGMSNPLKGLQGKTQRAQEIVNLSPVIKRAEGIVAVEHAIRQAQEHADEMFATIKLCDPTSDEAKEMRAEWRDIQASILKMRDQMIDLIGIPKRPADLTGRKGRGSQAPPVDAQVVSDHPGSDQNGLSNGLDAEPLP